MKRDELIAKMRPILIHRREALRRRLAGELTHLNSNWDRDEVGDESDTAVGAQDDEIHSLLSTVGKSGDPSHQRRAREHGDGVIMGCARSAISRSHPPDSWRCLTRRRASTASGTRKPIAADLRWAWTTRRATTWKAVPRPTPPTRGSGSVARVFLGDQCRQVRQNARQGNTAR